ncbi:MAG: hypothetical protein ACI4W6_07440, partial [Acutalibacteraceae bacterium]
MLLRKKQVLTATLLIALAAAVAVNWYYSRPTAESTQTTTAQANLGDTMLVAGSVQSEETTSYEEET